MYLFDPEDFKCDVIPSDWEDYATTIRELFNQNIKCLDNLIKSKQGGYTTEFYDKLWSLFQDYITAVDDCKAELYILTQELNANPSGSNCFDKTLYTNYIASFNVVQNLLQEINMLITTGGEAIGYDLNVGSDTTVIYPVSGSSSTKVSTCTGIYMKQMDFGSEFIGTVTVMGGVEEPVFENWLGLPRPVRDGEWIVRNY